MYGYPTFSPEPGVVELVTRFDMIENGATYCERGMEAALPHRVSQLENAAANRSRELEQTVSCLVSHLTLDSQ